MSQPLDLLSIVASQPAAPPVGTFVSLLIPLPEEPDQVETLIIMAACSVAWGAERVRDATRMSLGGLKPFGESLVGKDLLLEEGLLGEPDFDLKAGTLVHDSRSRLAVINEELFAGYLQRLSLLEVAHQTTEEKRLQNFRVKQADGLLAVLVRLVEFFVSVPDGSYPQDSDGLRHARVDLDLSAVVDCPELGSAVLDEELVVFDLYDLVFVQASAYVLTEIWL